MKVLLVIGLLLLGLSGSGQFAKASLQASGLTCAMCSKAVLVALRKISFVEEVKVNMKSQVFELTFRENSATNIDELRKAVKDAGFSIASLKVTGYFEELKVEENGHVKIGDQAFCFLNAENLILSGERTITMVDKSFLTAREYKKYSPMIKQTIAIEDTPVYHVII